MSFSFNFKKQFAAAVESREKRQTIRAERRDGRRPEPGETLHLFTGLRTKAARRLGTENCKSVHDISITSVFEIGAVVYVDGKRLQWTEVEELARADGFKTTEEFFDFFYGQHGATFHGFLTKW